MKKCGGGGASSSILHFTHTSQLSISLFFLSLCVCMYVCMLYQQFHHILFYTQSLLRFCFHSCGVLSPSQHQAESIYDEVVGVFCFHSYLLITSTWVSLPFFSIAPQLPLTLYHHSHCYLNPHSPFPVTLSATSILTLSTHPHCCLNVTCTLNSLSCQCEGRKKSLQGIFTEPDIVVVNVCCIFAVISRGYLRGAREGRAKGKSVEWRAQCQTRGCCWSSVRGECYGVNWGSECNTCSQETLEEKIYIYKKR